MRYVLDEGFVRFFFLSPRLSVPGIPGVEGAFCSSPSAPVLKESSLSPTSR